jgi:preprotein translocase subunit SecD
MIASILSGGALPVSIIVGSPGPIPPTLAKHFFKTSGIILIVAVVAVSLFIVIRYRRMFLIAPILITTLMELFIIGSIIGLVGTIDLSAVAGMIAVVGTGVDAQIIITDEVLARRGAQATAKMLLGNAFYIVWADALLLVVAMLPLFFSTSLVDVIGFSESTIIGALLGVLITRPAYGAIIEKHYE